MSKNLIFCAYALNPLMKTSVNLKHKEQSKIIYLRNIVVALVSAKRNNKECDVALVTNTELPVEFSDIFKKENILVIHEEFDEFKLPQEYKWGLAFYKLCALKKVLTRGYDNYLMFDTDTYTQSSLDDLWIETRDSIMLYSINQRFSNKDYATFYQESKDFLGTDKPIAYYGGEFIAGNKELLEVFIGKCSVIFDKMLKESFVTTHGDEFITCIAADQMRESIKNAGGYIFRFWTGTFRMISTIYAFDPISILHVPSEKEGTFIKLYLYYVKHNKFPTNQKVHKMFHFKRKGPWRNTKDIIKKILRRQ